MKNSIILSFLLFATLATAQERIIDFQSTLVVNKDRSVDVTEIITVKTEGINIQRGIFRDIITNTINNRGRKKQLQLDVKEVLKNGVSENYTVESVNNVDRIKIGNADKILEPGNYTYTIRYNLEQQVRFFDEYDEVYWNVNGNDWQFQIDKAEVKILLPDEAIISQHAGYSGFAGEQGCECKFDLTSPNSITYRMTTSLQSYQGFTVSVGWQKGVIQGPTQAEIEQEIFDENRSIFYGEIGLGVLATYLFIAWFFVGKDPKKEAIIPRFDPPDGFSPAACRYVQRMGFDNKAFTASVISMAVKGYLTIDNTNDTYLIKKVGESTDKLSAGEKKIASSLFSGKNSIELGGSYNSSVSSSIKNLKSQLKVDFQNLNFKKNYGWMVPAILVGVGTWFAVLAFISDSYELFFPVLISTLVLVFLVPNFIKVIRNFLNASGFSKILSAIPLLIFTVIFIVGPFYAMALTDLSVESFLRIYGAYFTILLGIASLITLFFYLIQAPTVFGRKRMDEIEGLILFMNAAEKDRLNMLNPPEKTPQLFERLLPYAVALGVENAWGKQFDSILQRAIQNNEYQPTWYIGNMNNMNNFSSMSSRLGSSMSSAVSTSSTPPSSSGSSGSSGGGSSGGGGGGGGGGGW